MLKDVGFSIETCEPDFAIVRETFDSTFAAAPDLEPGDFAAEGQYGRLTDRPFPDEGEDKILQKIISRANKDVVIITKFRPTAATATFRIERRWEGNSLQITESKNGDYSVEEWPFKGGHNFKTLAASTK